ncbi:MAG: hypothetical protein ACPL3S_01135, partial [Halothiobacillaceae bacterium]
MYKTYETKWQKTWRLLKKFHYLWVPLVIVYLDRLFILWPYYGFDDIPVFVKIALLETWGHVIWWSVHLPLFLGILLLWLWVVIVHIAITGYLCRFFHRSFKEISYRRAMENKALLTIHYEVAREQVQKYFKELYKQSKADKYVVEAMPYYFMVQALSSKEYKQLSASLPKATADLKKLAASPEKLMQYASAAYCVLKRLKELYVDRVMLGETIDISNYAPPSSCARQRPCQASAEATKEESGGAVVVAPQAAEVSDEKPISPAPEGHRAGDGQASVPDQPGKSMPAGMEVEKPAAGGNDPAPPVVKPDQEGEEEAMTVREKVPGPESRPG